MSPATEAPGKFPCSRCGACCRFVSRLTEEQRGEKIRTLPNGTCVHLRSDNTCDIYEDRPKICRVDAMMPDGGDADSWYRLNLAMCDVLHREAFGSPRISIVVED